MSVPFIPAAEEGTSLEGNIELSESDLRDLTFNAKQENRNKPITHVEILDFGPEAFLLHNVLTQEECQDIIEEGEALGFETIRGVRDDYRSCKRLV